MNNFLLVSFFFCMLIFLVAISIRAFYAAFFKKKDERSKWIVAKSMADSFVVIIILQAILLIIKMLNYDLFQRWWSNSGKGLFIEPFILSFMILGIALLINTKKSGGSL